MIDAEKASYPVTRMCQLLGVSRSGYHGWVARRQAGRPGPRAARQARLVEQIRTIHHASAQTYGAPRVTAELRAGGEVVSVKTVAKLMRQHGIRGISPRGWRPPTTVTDPTHTRLPDLVGRRFDQHALNRVWTSDITYLATGQGWLYLAAVRDGCSRRVLGYAFSDSLHTDVVETAMRRAVAARDGDVAGVILHADHGSQYTSLQLAKVAADELNIRLSAGGTGVCWDNAQQESFWSTLKTEHYSRTTFTTRTSAVESVTDWIENTYNRSRRHSALGMVSPVAFELRLHRNPQAA